MSRYERVNLRAQYSATPLGGQAQVHEWEVRFFDPATGAANSAFYTSPRDAGQDITKQARLGFEHEGPFPAGALPPVRPDRPSPHPGAGGPGRSDANAPPRRVKDGPGAQRDSVSLDA